MHVLVLVCLAGFVCFLCVCFVFFVGFLIKKHKRIGFFFFFKAGDRFPAGRMAVGDVKGILINDDQLHDFHDKFVGDGVLSQTSTSMLMTVPSIQPLQAC